MPRNYLYGNQSDNKYTSITAALPDMKDRLEQIKSLDQYTTSHCVSPSISTTHLLGTTGPTPYYSHGTNALVRVLGNCELSEAHKNPLNDDLDKIINPARTTMTRIIGRLEGMLKQSYDERSNSLLVYKYTTPKDMVDISDEDSEKIENQMLQMMKHVKDLWKLLEHKNRKCWENSRKEWEEGLSEWRSER